MYRGKTERSWNRVLVKVSKEERTTRRKEAIDSKQLVFNENKKGSLTGENHQLEIRQIEAMVMGRQSHKLS